jgi:hypothetical protein
VVSIVVVVVVDDIVVVVLGSFSLELNLIDFFPY